ncbi:hypothetical protein L1887_24473 [Cichorium endivia]|nr:hypothetical protein L1887_24473 [Cichorium endivia]
MHTFLHLHEYTQTQAAIFIHSHTSIPITHSHFKKSPGHPLCNLVIIHHSSDFQRFFNFFSDPGFTWI